MLLVLLRDEKPHICDSIAERLATILPDDKRQQLFSLIPKRDFDIAYRLDCRNLCADFNEDIEFHFSLGPMNLMQKLLGSKDRANFLVGSAGTVSMEITCSVCVCV